VGLDYGDYGDSAFNIASVTIVGSGNPRKTCYPAPMTRLEKIEQDIAALDPKDVRKLAEWLEEYKAELWDRQMEDDAKSGRLDKFAARALAAHKAGKSTPL
jgi:hypothetical protein